MKNKSNIKLIGIIVEVDGERKVIEKDFYFHGWSHETPFYNCGVDLSFKIDNKYKEISI